MTLPTVLPLREVRLEPDWSVPGEAAELATPLTLLTGEAAQAVRRRRATPLSWVCVHIGLRRNEFHGVLQFIDTTRHPENGPTYTEALAPVFWKNGGRMANLAPTFVEVFGNLAKTYGRSPDDVPASYLNYAVHTVIDGAGHTPRTVMEVDQLVKLGVENSPAAEAFRFLATLEKDANTPRPERVRRAGRGRP